MDKLILGKLSYLLLFSESRQLDVKTLDGPYNKKKEMKIYGAYFLSGKVHVFHWLR